MEGFDHKLIDSLELIKTLFCLEMGLKEVK